MFYLTFLYTENLAWTIKGTTLSDDLLAVSQDVAGQHLLNRGL